MILQLVLACQGTPPPEDLPTADVVDVGGVTVPQPAPVRGWRRMDVAQLDASIRRVTGGVGWDDEQGDSVFASLGPTLGVPDYLDATIEDRAPSLLFVKFLDDAANHVCDRLMEREKVGSHEPVLLRGVTLQDTVAAAPDAIEGALSDAVHRLHGRRALPGDPTLEPWRFLFESVEAIDGTESAWRAVCVGLLTHPDFYTY